VVGGDRSFAHSPWDGAAPAAAVARAATDAASRSASATTTTTRRQRATTSTAGVMISGCCWRTASWGRRAHACGERTCARGVCGGGGRNCCGSVVDVSGARSESHRVRPGEGGDKGSRHMRTEVLARAAHALPPPIEPTRKGRPTEEEEGSAVAGGVRQSARRVPAANSHVRTVRAVAGRWRGVALRACTNGFNPLPEASTSVALCCPLRVVRGAGSRPAR
jgi:hypothetical protein